MLPFLFCLLAGFLTTENRFNPVFLACFALVSSQHEAVIFAVGDVFSSKSSRMYDTGSGSGVSESSGGLAIISVIASEGHLPAHVLKHERLSQKTNFLLRIYSSCIRELFEENL